MTSRAWCPPIVFFIRSDSSIEISSPQIADGGHFYILRIAKLRHHGVQLRTAISNSNMPERDAIIRADNPVVGQSGRIDGSRSSGEHRSLLQEFPSIYFTFRWF